MTQLIDPTSDRLFRHMAWANARLFAVLATLPESVFVACEPGNDWSVGMITAHLAEAATSYASRLDGQPYADLPFERVSTHAELAIAAAACAGADARLHQAAHMPHGVIVRRDHPPLTRARTTVLAQAIHHATEHRAHIAGALIAHGVTALNLDDLDVWAFGDAEGLGSVKIDPISDRVFRHMAWANAQLFAVLQTLPDAVLEYSEPGNPWNVAMIVQHMAGSATAYARLLDETYQPAWIERPTTTAACALVANACADADARLHQAAQTPQGVIVRRDNPTLTRARTTVLAQAVHHATEHRAQIAGALIAHGVTALNLDDLDVWAFGDAEGLGA
jgi:uncharacterized damage-inducible protein DinB